MAITRAQQVRQMLEKGGRLGFFTGMREQEQREKAASNRESRRGGQYQSSKSFSPSAGPAGGASAGGNYGGNVNPQQKTNIGAGSAKSQKLREEAEIARKLELERKAKEKKAQEEKALLQSIEDSQIQKKNKFRQMFDRIKGFKPPTMALIEGALTNLQNPFDDIISEIQEDKNLSEKLKARGYDLTTEAGIEKYKDARQAGQIGAYGRMMGGYDRDPFGNIVQRDGGQDQPIVPIVPTTTGIASTDVVDNRTEFEKLLASRPGAFRFFADGGRADDEEDYVGGIMDLESARQMYGLGKLVKKVTRGVKKIVKSPIGKAALLYGAGSLGAGLMGKAKAAGGFKSFLLGAPKKMIAGPISGLLGTGSSGTMGILGKLGLTKGAGSLALTGLGKSILGIGIPSLIAGALTPKQKQELYQEEDDFDIAAIRKDPYAAMGEAYNFYADGGKAEPVAKKTMPLLDMDGMEKDYREDGGFVPIGRMERADDVPARLSKNEFVFTADAVRNAGDGDVDKGAEVMYNMMKNLEAGGNVSEESQGLDGARKMFQTSQRLEEVL